MPLRLYATFSILRQSAFFGQSVTFSHTGGSRGGIVSRFREYLLRTINMGSFSDCIHELHPEFNTATDQDSEFLHAIDLRILKSCSKHDTRGHHARCIISYPVLLLE
eukprot:COSAG02_NODE_366_length_23740_cov_20.235904_9_plen_107_part_00